MVFTTVTLAPEAARESAGMRVSRLPLQWPALMDQITGPAPQQATTIADLARPISAGKPRARIDLLDLGSGTGRLLGALAQEIPTGRYVGVEWQPALVEYAEQHYPEACYRLADLRTARLAQTFDVITCVGDTLGDVNPRQGDLTLLCQTLAEHAHLGTLLVMELPSAVPQPERSQVFDPAPGPFRGPVEMTSSVVPMGFQRQCVTRTWDFGHSTVIQERYLLWVHTARSVETRLAKVGFQRRTDAGDLLVFQLIDLPPDRF